MRLTNRGTHRDLAYFFLGLIISFSISGIFLNHRRIWHPQRYIYDTKPIQIKTPVDSHLIDDDYIAQFSKQNNIEESVRRFSVYKGQLRINYASLEVEIDIQTGKGSIIAYKTTPILGQLTKLHVNTSNFWIYYSDAFGISMLIIAITGMFIEKGKNSFWKRGWWLALIGTIFPLIFLFLLS